MAIRPSQRFALMLILFHAMVVIVIFATVMPLAAMLAMLMLILISLLYCLARDALLFLPDSWREFSFDQERVSVVTTDGSVFSGRFTGKTTVGRYFAVLSVKREERRLPVFWIIFPDALGADRFRELCINLKFAKKLS